ncbi:MAG: hypothetical protein B7Z80_24145 [Rhodospirillales bacterium 20-64-7]|nr:MAG: hypothetical protein B7Z80_24145 [Rhodospirillales bacterium 20-64-7]
MAQAPAPPAPVGHVYQSLVSVPPAPKWVHIKPDDQEKIQTAFNVIGLKSALMVGALSCGQQNQYDTFMRAFQPHILADQHMMDAYFRRIGGQTKEDQFVTLLANNQSVGGLEQGKIFCLNNEAEFERVASFKTPEELDSFVTDQSPTPIVTAVVDPTPVHPKKIKKPIKHTSTTSTSEKSTASPTHS